VNVSSIIFHLVHYFYSAYVRHLLNTIVFFWSFLAPPLAQGPRQLLSSPNGSAGPARRADVKPPYLKLSGDGSDSQFVNFSEMQKTTVYVPLQCNNSSAVSVRPSEMQLTSGYP